MKWINTPLKLLRLLALALMLGSGLASAAEPVASQQNNPVVEAAAPSEVSPATHIQLIRLAWDRVGTMA